MRVVQEQEGPLLKMVADKYRDGKQIDSLQVSANQCPGDCPAKGDQNEYKHAWLIGSGGID